MSSEPPELRFADGPSTEASIDIGAPLAAVWALVTDIALPARFSSEFQGADWMDGAETPTIGARFVGRNHHAAIGTWETISTVTALEFEREFAYDVDGIEPGRPGATWCFRLEPDGDGTRLTQWMRIGPGPSGLTPALEAMPDKESKILYRRLSEHRANMEANLTGIKELAEGTRRSP
ncbi:MAG: SRPBCC family protein [Desertimonas sp.]